MSNRVELSDSEIEEVVGGVFSWNPKTNKMTYTHEDGSKTSYTIVDYDNAWSYSNRAHAANLSEDEIVSRLKQRGYIK